MIIKAAATLRKDYGKLSAPAHEVGKPIYITKNGEGDIVVMSIDAFEKRKQLISLKAMLAMSERALMNGEPIVSLSEARERLEPKYG